jgi:hypothetical protein
VFDKAFYNLSYQLGRRANDLRSLLNTDAGGLQASGVSADSVARLLAIAAAQRIPTAVGKGLASSRLSDQGSLFGSFDFTPPGSSSGTTMSLTLNGNWNRQTPGGQSHVGAAGARRRPHQLESRRAGPAHVVREEHPAQRDDAQPQRQPQLRHAVPHDAERLGARELQLSRRHERRAHARLRRQRLHGHQQQHAERRGDQSALVVQPEQQAR